MFACAIIIGFFGMLRVTFRASHKPTLYSEDPSAVLESDEVTMNTAEAPDITVLNTDNDLPEEVEILTPTEPPDDSVYSDFSDQRGVAVQIN